MSTALLMDRLYKNLVPGDPGEDSDTRSPLPPAKALRQAQIWLRDKVTAKYVRDYLTRALNEGYIEESQAIAYRRVYEDWSDKEFPFKSLYHWAAFTVSGAGNKKVRFRR
jgi:CHAT domain-containing protein